jgi:hypothetical protein
LAARTLCVYGAVWGVGALGFALAPIPFDDWRAVRTGALHLFDWHLYDGSGYYNLPYVALALFPLATLPAHIGYALLNGFSLVCALHLSQLRHWSPARLVLFVTSMPFVLTLLHGNIDAPLLLGLLLAPEAYRGVIIAAKPQNALGLLPSLSLRAWVVLAVCLWATYLVWVYPLGWDWPLRWLQLVNPVMRAEWNWASPVLWVVALLAWLYSYERKDTQAQLALSPFLLTYFAPSSLLPLAYAACERLPLWGVALVSVCLWLALLM